MKETTHEELVSNIVDSCHDDVKSQLDYLQEMIARKNPDEFDVIFVAAENIIKTVRGLSLFSLEGTDHGMA